MSVLIFVQAIWTLLVNCDIQNGQWVMWIEAEILKNNSGFWGNEPRGVIYCCSVVYIVGGNIWIDLTISVKTKCFALRREVWNVSLFYIENWPKKTLKVQVLVFYAITFDAIKILTSSFHWWATFSMLNPGIPNMIISKVIFMVSINAINCQNGPFWQFVAFMEHKRIVVLKTSENIFHFLIK